MARRKEKPVLKPHRVTMWNDEALLAFHPGPPPGQQPPERKPETLEQLERRFLDSALEAALAYRNERFGLALRITLLREEK